MAHPSVFRVKTAQKHTRTITKIYGGEIRQAGIVTNKRRAAESICKKLLPETPDCAEKVAANEDSRERKEI